MLQAAKEKRDLPGRRKGRKSLVASGLRTGPGLPVPITKAMMSWEFLHLSRTAASLLGPHTNEKVGPLVQKLLRIVRWQQPVIGPRVGGRHSRFRKLWGR